VPVLSALRAALPQAFLAWVVEGRAGDVLAGHPALDELVRVPRGWLGSPGEVWRLRRRLRVLRFDATIDLQCLTKSAIAARLAGARRRIGKAGSDGRELSKWFHNELVACGGTHVIEHYLELLKPLGIESPGVRFDLPEMPADEEKIDVYLRSVNLAGGAFAVLNPGAGWPSKIWPAERYGELARRLAKSHGLVSVAAWGAPSELPLAEAIVAASGGHARLAPPTSIMELAAPSRADWCGAYGPENIRLQVRYEDGSALERRKADDSAMRAIEVEMVAEACDRLLQANKGMKRQCG
jgi:ADP-heptose:LPS heptosyltransferase